MERSRDVTCQGFNPWLVSAFESIFSSLGLSHLTCLGKIPPGKYGAVTAAILDALEKDVMSSMNGQKQYL